MDRDDVAKAWQMIFSDTYVDTCAVRAEDVGCSADNIFPSTCPFACSYSIDVDHYVNQNQFLQNLLEKRGGPPFKSPSTESCTTIDCNIWDTTYGGTDAQLQNGALVAQFLCPETCKAPVSKGSTTPYISISGACEGSGINGDYAYDGSIIGGGTYTFSQGDRWLSILNNVMAGGSTVTVFEGNSYIDDPTKLPMGTRTWQVDCDLNAATDAIDQQVTIVAIPPPLV